MINHSNSAKASLIALLAIVASSCSDMNNKSWSLSSDEALVRKDHSINSSVMKNVLLRLSRLEDSETLKLAKKRIDMQNSEEYAVYYSFSANLDAVNVYAEMYNKTDCTSFIIFKNEVVRTDGCFLKQIGIVAARPADESVIDDGGSSIISTSFRGTKRILINVHAPIVDINTDRSNLRRDIASEFQ